MRKVQPTLQKGERVKLAEDGPLYTVVRVTPCAAYLRGGEVREVRIGEQKPFYAACGDVLAVSTKAFVYREPR